jgi:hypothetical protein
MWSGKLRDYLVRFKNILLSRKFMSEPTEDEAFGQIKDREDKSMTHIFDLPVLENSNLVGKTPVEVEKTCGVKIDTDQKAFSAGRYLTVEGDKKSLDKFFNEYLPSESK